jgi:hypothetical protein
VHGLPVGRIKASRELGLVALLILAAVVLAGPAAADSAAACPCSLWSTATTPANAAEITDRNAVELGVKFRPGVDGTITALRFYKATTNTGVHVGNLWSAGGTRLATVTFGAETSSGWQQASLSSPVAVTASTTYIASYHAPNGNYAFDSNYFATAVVNGPLRALSSSEGAGNGVYSYGASAFPANTYNATNYWVDVVFSEAAAGPDTTPPTVTSVSPSNGATAVNAGMAPTATFSEAMNAATITTSTVQLSGPGGTVPASVSYDAAEGRAVLTPTGGLADSTTYTMTVKGGAAGVADAANNRLAADRTWSFTTAAATPPPDSGPGGPILVITKSSNPFTQYNAEILRAEGLNEFAVRDISTVSTATLAGYDVAILGDMTLTAAQVTTLGDWVGGGGNLIAMRPDPQLATLLGLSGGATTLANGYVKVDTSRAPGAGIVGDTIQYHGTATRWSLNGATSVATLYSDASTATASPAVTLRDVGANGGQAAAFTYDLARSVVTTRQGNPAWAGLERDGEAPIRSDDMFFGGATATDWINLAKVGIPQADEQQRLLANLIGTVAADRKPLPRFWYLPRDAKAAVVMTGDDHGNGGSDTVRRFNSFAAASPAGCSVAAWECVRGTSYVFPGTITAAQADQYTASGFEVALHVTTGCADYTAGSLASNFTDQLGQFRAMYPNLPAVVSNRTHCIPWSDWASHPKVELANGVRFDTNYYYWPGSWIGDRPGFFTGSGMPMRFGDSDGSMIDVYQAATQMTDESGQPYPSTIDALLNGATGPAGYYGVFTANMHDDFGNTESATSAAAIVASAKARGVPVVSSKQMLTWLDGRNRSSLGSITWSANTLRFTVTAAAGASGLRGMVPAAAGGAAIASITRNGSSIPFTRQQIKGVDYAFFDATDGSYAATYAGGGGDSTAPVISAVAATATAAGVATVSWSTNEPSTSRVDYGGTAASLSQNVSDATRVSSHSMQITGLTPGTTYYFRVSSADAAGNSATSPAPPAAAASFNVPAATAVRAPSAVVIDTGSLRSGTFADLAAADTAYFRTNSTTPLLGTRTSSWYGRMTSVPTALTSLKVTYAGFNSRSCTQVLQVYRWTTSSWVQIDSRAVSTTQVTISDLSPTGAAANYVSPAGEVRVRVLTTATASFNTAGNLMRITYGS